MGDLIAFPRRQVREPFLPKRHVARVIGVHHRSIERWIAAGLPSRLERGQRRVRLSEAMAWRDGHRTEATA